MKYVCKISLDLPRERVVELFDDPENMKKWQPGLQSFEPLGGEPGRPGARSRLVYREGRRRIEMIETVVERTLPDRFTGTYEAKGVHNVVANHFFLDESGRTRWITSRNSASAAS